MRVVLALLIAGCGAKNFAEPVGNRAGPPPKPTCTETRVAAIAKALQARWNTPTPPLVRCTPGLFPTPGFFIEVEGSANHTAILAADATTELVPYTNEGTRFVATAVIACSTIDLDGDGVEEIVESHRRSTHGRMGSLNWIEIRRIVDGKLVTTRGPYTTVHHPELGRCNAEVRLAGRTIVVDVTHEEIPPSDCLAAGTHMFALERGAVIEIERDRLSRR